MARGLDKMEAKQELLRVYQELGRPFSRREFNEFASGGFHSRSVERCFGSWTAAVRAAGLEKKFEAYETVQAERTHFKPEAFVEAQWNEDKKKLVAAEEARRHKWLRSQSQKLELVKEALEQSIAKMEPLHVDVRVIKAPRARNALGNVTLWFEFSDLQLGTLMTSEEMGGLNRHNWTIWKEKLGVWVREVLRIIAEYRDNYTVDRVVIAMLGDMVEGQDIFAGQTWQIDKHVVDQTLYGGQDTAGAFLQITGAFPDVPFEILEVFGNHGRLGKKGEQPYSCSFDKIYQRVVEMQMQRAGLAANVTWHKNEAWFYLVDIYGWNHLLLHGDQGVSGLWSSRPTINGLEKGVVRYNQMMQQQIHFVHCGHFHQEWALSFNMSYMLINGSFIGTSKFSASKMVSASPPVQMMHVFEERVGLVRTERIHLTDGAVLQPIEPHKLGGGA